MMFEKVLGAIDMSTETKDDCLEEIVDELLQRLRRGEEIDWPACFAEHPRSAEELRRLAPMMVLLVTCLSERRSRESRPSN